MSRRPRCSRVSWSSSDVTMPNAFARRARKAALAASLAAALASVPHCAAVSPIPATPASVPAGRWRDASRDDYRAHLRALTTLVEACARARDPKNCDPMRVGPDDRVPLGSGANAERRRVRYGWLRVLLSKSGEADKPVSKEAAGAQSGPEPVNGQPAPPTTSQLLQDAERRLAQDLDQAQAAPVPEPAHTAVRNTMKQVLAGREFRNLAQLSARQQMLERVNNWLNRLFASVSALRATAAWVGRAVVWGFILAVCVGLVWGLLQVQRRWRVRLVPDDVAPAAGAASARDWQLWLEDARRAAAAGQWREAIHFVYWASISRLESKRMWPADRARTPREYLALVAPEDPRKAGLARLTGSFERVWYGGRAAVESDYRKAEELADGLIAGGAAAGGADRPVVAEGGAR